jgi:2-desacetyl-2-hydroxyethyl bacteriochlorophyllide A dehydrogenase
VRAGVVTAPEQIEIRDIPAPVPGPYQARVEVLYTGFCTATDSKVIQGHWPGVDPFPIVLGHESVGRVVELGPRVSNLQVGDLVLQARIEGDPALGLGTGWGSFVDQALATDWRAMQQDGLPLTDEFVRAQTPVPRDMDPLAAVALVTLREVHSALRHFGVPAGRPVLICGDGPVGVMMVHFASRLGAGPVILAGHHDDRLARGQALGARHTFNTRREPLAPAVRAVAPGGVALVVDAAGANRVWQQGLDLLADGGRIGVYGYSDERSTTLDWSRAPQRWALDYLVVPQLDRLLESHDLLVADIMSGALDAGALISDVVPLEALGEVYRAVQARRAFKPAVRLLA